MEVENEEGINKSYLLVGHLCRFICVYQCARIFLSSKACILPQTRCELWYSRQWFLGGASSIAGQL